MSFVNIKRVARYGMIGFIRNGFVSLAAIFIMTITLFVIASLLISGAALKSVLTQLTEKVDVNVYLQPTATEDEVTQLKQSLEALPEVASVTYVSRDEALARYKERHKNDQTSLQALDILNDNPLEASLGIRAKNTSQYEAIAQYITAQQSSGTGTGAIIHKINFFQNKAAIDKLTNIIETSRKLGIGIALIFGIESLLIAFNTIRLVIYIARDEIGVMNLVGASHWYVRGPFMIAGVLYGIISGVIVLLLLYPLTAWLGPISEEFLGTFNVFTYYLESSLFIFVVVMGGGILLGALSSYLAVRRYLRT